jgi:pSer/pThr/pTyr-binding forkhead associated (FHA) protein
MICLWKRFIRSINQLIPAWRQGQQLEAKKINEAATDKAADTTIVYQLAQPRSQSTTPTRELMVVGGPQCGTTFSLWGEKVLIGRSETNHIMLFDENISRTHIMITFTNNKDLVEDLGSLNGTLINGYPLLGHRQLQVGDRITLGSTVLEYRG